MNRKLFEQSGKNAIVVVPACARSVEGLAETIERAADRADVVEVRLDYLPASEIATGARLALESVFAVPLLLTLRPRSQGGEIDLDLAARREFWSALSNHNSFFDWELDLAESFTVDGPSLDWDRIVCSYHDFTGVPADLTEIFQRMRLTPALILKLAVTAREVTDCLSVLNCLDQARYAKRELIAIAMGEAGLLTRVLGSAFGSRVTYAAADADSATAPGQLTADELLDRYRVKQVNKDTQVFGIIGIPVSHSLSPAIHNAAFAGTGVDGVYLPLPVEKCGAFLRRLVHPKTREFPLNWRGLSVTAPHKRGVMEHLDRIDPIAEEIGAVNTIVVEGDQLRGCNTDAEGFIAPLAQRSINLRGMRCAVLGAGGGARAAVWGLQRSGALTTVLARHPDRARLLGREFAAEFGLLDGAPLSEFELVVNTTPLGTRGSMEVESVATSEQLRGVRLAYDLVYNPPETSFMRAAATASCETLGGLEMLVAQAAVQFRLWTGLAAPEEEMKRAANERLKN